ncbi:MAG TPA: site-specific integrase [Propionibacteriaceae bacterium]|nr:site-specific integrase [Propionibacteriaceae bacterium]
MMVARRSRGEGSLFWNEKRQRWIGIVSQGYAANGKRRTTWVSGRTKTEAKTKLREAQRARDDGLPAGRRDYTVRQAVESWLEHGLAGRDPSTVRNRTILARRHVLPALGSRRLAELTADEVDRWLTGESKGVSTDTLAKLLSILRQSIRRAQARDLVQRNVALLCEAPKGTVGRPSKSLSLEQAGRLLMAAEGTSMHAYVVVSLLTGARTEELRALTWSHLDLEGDASGLPPTPPSIQLWRSVRAGGETKTKRSRRTLELPTLCVDALREHRHRQLAQRIRMGQRWLTTIWCSPVDTAPSSTRPMCGVPCGPWRLEPDRELRHSFISLLSSSGVPIEDIAHLVGHASTSVTEKVYRKELRPVLSRGATAMDALFGRRRAGRSD